MHDDFLVQLQPRILAGQLRFRSTMKRLVQLSRPDLFKILSAHEGDAFLEPLAFLSFSLNQPTSNLDQIFAGYLVCNDLSSRLTISTESDGSCYVPGLGYFTTDQKNSKLELAVSANRGSMYLEHRGTVVPYDLEPVVRLSETSIELIQRPVGLLANCFVSEGNSITVEISKAAAAHAANLAKAVTIISRLWPTLYQALIQTVRGVVLFHSGEMNSFATTTAHGMAFINSSLGDNEVFFVEDIAHQCGHIIFSAASVDAAEAFIMSPATPLAVFNGQSEDQRSIYVVLHGVFTEALMAKCLDACLTEKVFDASRQHELQGRLAFIMRRFAADLRNISRSGILSTQGEDLVHALYVVWTEIMIRRREMIDACDFSGQSYNFCYRTFAEQNSIFETQALESGTS